MKTYKDYLSIISKDDILIHYDQENRTMKEACEYFSVSQGIFIKILKHYGIHKSKSSHVAKIKQAKKDKYGDENYNNQEKRALTNINKYGVDNQFKRKDIFPQIQQNKIDKYGTVNNVAKNHQTRISNYGSLKQSYIAQQQTYRETCQKRYGVTNISQLEETKEKIRDSLRNTFSQLYGSSCYWTSDNAKRSNGSMHSNANDAFAQLLLDNNIDFEREFKLNNKIYDFKIDNKLVEINPTPTHNVIWSPFSNKGIDINYHQDKTTIAESNGYQCIHVWDWDDQNKIIQLLKKRDVIQCRLCKIKELSAIDAANFLNSYHLQGYAKDSLRLGLMYNDNIVAVMTFGKPRYNKNYEWELIRYCCPYYIKGAAEKLFKYFMQNYNPKSIISYCDKSKFKGTMYYTLSFNKLRSGKPSAHWYNIKEKRHITANLLQYRGFDQIFKTNYGKGTDNEQLMLEHNYLKVYDCGQDSYSWHKED